MEKKPAAERLFFERFAGFSLVLCRRYSRDQMEAEDLQQIGFLKCFHNLEKFRGVGPLGAWVRRVFVHSCLDELRKRNGFETWLNPTEDLSFKQVSEDNAFLLETDSAELVHLISTLPDGSRAVFNLHAVEGYSHQEVAAMLGISESTSRVHLTRARAVLQEKVSILYSKPLITNG